MEVYILDDLLRRNTIIDRYESCIWTERYSAHGDFQLVIHSNLRSRSQLVEGTRLTINKSKKVMVIENVENRDDSEGRSLLTVTGRSLEASLQDRAVRRDMDGLDTDPTFVLDPNPPATALRSLFNYICVAGSLDEADVIPLITAGSLYPVDTIAEPEENVTLAFDPTDLYTAIKQACDVYGLGFRLYRGPDTETLYFNIYIGSDRTSSQTSLPAVIFSPDLENITNTAEFRSIEKYKNVALVISKLRSVWVFADDAAVTATGLDRRVLTVNATDIEIPAYGITQAQVSTIETILKDYDPVADADLFVKLANNTTLTTVELDILKSYITSGTSPLTAPQKTALDEIIVHYEDWRATVIPAHEELLTKRGQDELTKYKPMKAIDGEIALDTGYRYGVDYELGDLVEMRNDDGLTNRMRVTEQIFVDDVQGERSYPTLALDEFITPGTWFAWDANGVWDDALGTWDDQPE